MASKKPKRADVLTKQELTLLDLARNNRKPQTEYEKRLKAQLDDIARRGRGVEIPSDF